MIKFQPKAMGRKKSLSSIYKSLRPYVEEVGQSKLIKPDFYQIALKAALIKSFDFNLYVSQLKSKSHSFYITATLRGICEDIIVFKALKAIPKRDRSKLISYIQMHSVYESMKSQKDFFEQNRPYQPILCFKDIDTKIQTEEARMFAIYGKYGLLAGNPKKPRKTSVRQLAIKCGLLPIYDFFYAATSKWVHFNPHILMRMGWTKEEDAKNATYIFSTAHFNLYYAQFNRIYGAYLFILFYDTFAKQLKIDAKAKTHITELKEFLNDIPRWADVITFEEMNIEPPSELIYVIANVVKNDKKKSKK